MIKYKVINHLIIQPKHNVRTQKIGRNASAYNLNLISLKKNTILLSKLCLSTLMYTVFRYDTPL